MNLLGFIKKVLRGVWKLLVGPLIYRKGQGYDAARYWGDRLGKSGDSILGPGHQGMSVEENLRMYEAASSQIFALAEELGIDWTNARVLEVGLGNGYYMTRLKQKGVQDYTGIDITDVQFDAFQKVSPGIDLRKMDVGQDRIDGEFDVILFIDVVQHIVEREKFEFAIRNLTSCLAEDGVFFINPIAHESAKKLFYLASWSIQDLRPLCEGLSFSPMFRFRDSFMVILKKGKLPSLTGIDEDTAQ